MFIRNKRGPDSDLCGTLHSTICDEDGATINIGEQFAVIKIRFEPKMNQFNGVLRISQCSSFFSKISCLTVSNAFCRSRYMPMLQRPSFKLDYISSTASISARFVEQVFRNPYWCLQRMLLLSKQFSSLIFINFSNNLWKHDNKEIGRQLVQRKLSPFLKSGITLATLSCSGKTEDDISVWQGQVRC